MSEIDYGRLDAIEAFLGGRAAIQAAYEAATSPVVSANPSGGFIPWATGLVIGLNQLVSNAGSDYLCTTAHTAGGSFDATKFSVIGGAPAGVSVTHKFPFAFDTPGLATGIEAVFTDAYTVAADDILEDAWIEIDTAWDGTTPTGDVGEFATVAYGWWGSTRNGAKIDMTGADSDFGGGGEGLLTNAAAAFSPANGNYPLSAASVSLYNTGGLAYPVFTRPVPARFTAANPIKVVVSTTGNTDGADPGSTIGSAVLYVKTSSPA